MIGHLSIHIGQEDLIWRLVKHLVVKINWLMLLNGNTLHTRLSTKSNNITQHLFNYNLCQHWNVSVICVENIIKGRIHLR